MIQVLVSSSNEERLAAARAFVDSFPPAAEARLIGASRDAVDQLVYELSDSRRATFGLCRFSLTQLAARLATAEFARQGLAHSTPLGAEAVAARATFEALDRVALPYFAPVARHPGFARALASTLQALRLAGVRPEQVAKVADPGPDLATLLTVFEERFADASLADRAALFRAATQALPGERPMPALLLDVPVATPAERGFVAALAARSPQVLVTVPAGDDATLAAWATIEGARTTTVAEGNAASGLARLRRHLFSDTPPPESESGDEVRFFSAPGEGRECVEIARRILEEARNGVRFDRIAVLLRDPATYSGFLETALARAGIPAYFSRGTRRPDPVGRAFLALLACAAERLSAKRFAEYLSLGEVPALDETGAPPPGDERWAPSRDEALGSAAEAAVPEESEEPKAVATNDSHGSLAATAGAVVEGTLRAPWRWEEFLVEAAVIGGHDRWARRLSGLEAEWRLRLGDLQREERESARAQALERKLGNLDHLRRFALPVVEALAGFPSQAKWGAWLAALEQLAPRVLRRPQRALAVLAEFKPMATVGPVGVHEVYDVLAPRLSTLEQEPPPRPYGRVFAGTLELARGRWFEVVFVPGVAERIFPQKPREDPLLLDALRQQLRDDGAPGLEQQDDRLSRERLLLRLAAGAASKRIHFSYPRLELSKARQRAPSFYALDVKQATTGGIPDFEELEREAAHQSAAGLAWAAPAQPSLAIDDTEHDLAVMGELLRTSISSGSSGSSGSPGSSLQGRARYLLELNPHLARSLRTRWARWRKGAKWSAYDGLCDPSPAARAALAAHRLTARPFSASALQHFATCPYRFFLAAIYRLEPREEAVPLEQMDPLTRGHLFHRVQAELQRRLAREKLLPVSAPTLEAALADLGDTLHQVAEEYREKLAPAIPRVWLDAVESVGTDLRVWLHRLAEAAGEAGWQPWHFEYGFGFSAEEGRDPESAGEPVTLNGYKLHGVVDLIERRAGPNGEPELRVTDHKTGQNRTREGAVIGGGEVLQPVLYGMAVEAAKRERVVESRLYYCTTRGHFDERRVEMNEINRQRGLLALTTVERAIEAGFFPPAPLEKACAWCDFLDVCGPYEELRAARKDPDRLSDLMNLRCQP